MDLSLLLPPFHVKSLVNTWLSEDLPAFDVGGAVVGEVSGTAVLLCKSPGILAGVPFFDAVFKQLDCSVEWNFKEGTDLLPIAEVGRVYGKTNSILQGERVALNVLARASGVATAAARTGLAVKQTGWSGRVTGTRKTTPGFRLVEKYALHVGNVDTHRYDLSSMVMLKDNHIKSVGNVEMAIEKAKKLAGHYIKIEVECKTLEEALCAAKANCDVIMLDNLAPKEAVHTAEVIKSKFPQTSIEVSGGIRIENITDYCSPSIDFISCGNLTNGYSTIDYSLKLS